MRLSEVRGLVLSLGLAAMFAAANSGHAREFRGLGDLPGGEHRSHACAVSADGKTVVGFSQSGSGREAFRWTREGGLQSLEDLPGGEMHAEASAVSAGGSVIVGAGAGAPRGPGALGRGGSERGICPFK